MAVTSSANSNGWLARKHIDGVYIPAGLLIVGMAIVKFEWIFFSVAAAIILGGWKLFNSRVRKVLKPKEYQSFELKEKTVITHNVAMFGLPRPTDILGLPIGQHISIQAECPTEKGLTKITRSYTPVSSDHEPGHFDLLIKSYPMGNISKYMATLKIGETINVQGPKGQMVYTPNLVKRFGMIAGGTGITPMLQIIRAVIRGRPKNGGNDTTRIDLIFANVEWKDILLKEDLDALAEEDDGFNVYYVLNSPPEGWKGGVGFVSPDMIKASIFLSSSKIALLTDIL
ncbi:MAG: NADH-cytochrome b5 reductase [Vezdaea acicularis]|nr:MAG: NADH-cytochrome b5 reductase [Vezdaea acicularis]